MYAKEVTLESVNYATVRVHPDGGETSIYVELCNPVGVRWITAAFDSITEATATITRWCLWNPEENAKFLMKEDAPHQA